MGAGFDNRFEAVENAGPKRIEVRLERGNAGRIDLVDALSTGAPITDQASILEYAQVLGNGGPADRKAPRQFDHRQRPLSQASQYDQAGGITERMKTAI